MPTLDFKGKQFVYSHHLSVPFRELRIDPDKSLPAPGKTPSLDDNLIIHGDNLEALKALLPTHAGKVDCIFIDPPYNTGNEGWCYNDNVRSPLMQEWLKKSANPVDKEDLERHDKWLCMMWPRLMLLKELLSEKGCIWITLDDNEAHRFKVLMDEIFGDDNFVTSIAWQKMYTVKNSAKYFSEMHDHVFVYAKNINLWERKLLSDEGKEENYSNPDNDPRGPWTTNAIQARNFYSQGSYEIIAPSGRVHTPPKGTFWRISQENFNTLNSDKRIWWGKGGDSIPRIKKFLSESKDGVVPSTLWSYKDAGSNATAKDQLRSIFSDSDSDLFMTPKPDILIQRILQISSNKDSIILDSFAGSGTTAQAVLNMNNIDGGCRRFILIECEDYAETLTAERVRRVIKGYKFKGTIKTELYSEKLSWNSFEKKHQLITEKINEITEKYAPKYNVITRDIKDGVIQVIGEKTVEELTEGVPGSFTYCILGEAIQVDSLLTGNDMPSFESLARYVFYTATGHSLHSVAKASVDGFIGETDLFRIHLFYQPDQNWLRSNDAALNSDKVKSILSNNSTKKRTIVFAVAKFMSQRDLTAARIEFCQLPYAIHRIMGA